MHPLVCLLVYLHATLFYRDSNSSQEVLGEYLLSGGVDDLVKVWELKNDRLELKHKLEGHSLGIVSVALSADGTRKYCYLIYYSILQRVNSRLCAYR